MISQLQYQFPQYMFKQFICVLSILTLTLAITDTEIIQQSLNGIFEQNKFADPTTITDCGDDDLDHKIVVYIGTSLDKLSKGTVTDLLNFYYDVPKFVNSLPQPLIDCINANDEVDQLAVSYNIKGTDPAVIERKLITYITLHFLTVHKWLVQLDNLWNAGNYYQFGFNGAGYAHQVLGMSLTKYIKQMRQRYY